MRRLKHSPPILATLFFFLMAGCAGLNTGYDQPTVTVSSFKAVPGQGPVPRFEIGLHIVNPNRTELSLKGVAYTIEIEGHKIMTGVAKDLPVIEAYSEEEVILTGTVSLFNSIAFFADLAGHKNLDGLSYSLEAKLDPGALHPVIRVTKKGTLSLEPPQ
ncbi:MAG: LEA type 2 family protein [Desulfobacter sp.]|nr:MAG: LEA type 2 family protein [Desulfobacter sp.]